MLLCGDSDSPFSISASPIHPKSQILPSSPPGSHNSRLWRSISRGSLRPSFSYLLWMMSKVALCFYVRILTRFSRFWYLQSNQNPRFCRHHPHGSHNSHHWDPSSEGNRRPSSLYLLWVIKKVEQCFYIGILTRFTRFWHLQFTQNPRFCRRHPPGAIIVALGTQAVKETSAKA